MKFVTNTLNLVALFQSSLKALSVMGFTTIFMYWSIAAVTKYMSVPITSTVSYKFGDDGHGSIVFPTVTICLESFKWIVKSQGMNSRCMTENFDNFYDALLWCTYDSRESPKTTTEYSLIGNLFDEPNVDPINKFKKLQDFLNASEMLDITDILRGFKFGYRHHKILSTDGILSKNTREKRLKEWWKPIIHFEKGLCYSFEPKSITSGQFGQDIPVYYGGDILHLELDFDVS